MSVPTSPAEPFDAAVVDHDDYVRDGVGRLLSTMPGTDRIACCTDVRSLLGRPPPRLVVLEPCGRRGTGWPGAMIDALVTAGARVVIHTLEERPVLLRSAVDAGVAGVALKRDGADALAACLAPTAADDPSFSSDLARYLATDPAAAPQLSPRLVDVLRALGDGMTRQQTASHLGISEHTVSDYLAGIRTRHLQLGRHVTNTAGLVRQAVRDGHLD